MLAVIGVLGFSFKAILIKLAYGWHSIDAVTLLTLRMLYSAPFFALMAWWAIAARGRASRSRAATGSCSSGSASSATTSRACSTSSACSTSPPRSSDWSCSFIRRWSCCCRAVMFKQRVGVRAAAALVLSYAGILLVFAQRSPAHRRPARAGARRRAGFRQRASATRSISSAPGRSSRAWAACASSRGRCWPHRCSSWGSSSRRDPGRALAAPASIQLLSLTMAVCSTVLPTWLIAEAIKRIGANRTVARRFARSGVHDLARATGFSASRSTRFSSPAPRWSSLGVTLVTLRAAE